MKRFIIIVFIFLFFVFYMRAEQGIAEFEQEVKELLGKVSPSLVKVVSQKHKRYIATGIAIDKHHVITNRMVTRYPYDSIYILTVNGDRQPARVAGSDKESSILLLEIEGKALKPVKKAEVYAVGDWIALLGVFYKRFPSIYQGIVSSQSPEEVILNAPVAPGAAGGAVVNKEGELIGVIRGRFGYVTGPDYTFRDHSSEIFMTSPRSPTKDLCYAIPVSKVTRIAEDLKAHGKVRWGYLGVGLNYHDDIIEVGKISKDSPAERAGLLKGDILLAMDGQEVSHPQDVLRIIKYHKPQEKIKIKVRRQDGEKLLTASVGEAGPKEIRVNTAASPGSYYFSWSGSTPPREIPERTQSLPGLQNYVLNLSSNRTLGLDAMSLTPELAGEFNVAEGHGLLVSRIAEGSAAAKSGLRTADIIVKAGKTITRNHSDLRGVLDHMKDGESMRLTVYRKGKLHNIDVVPDKISGWGSAFEDFRKKMGEINVHIEEKKTGQTRETARYSIAPTEPQLIKQYQLKIEHLQKEQNKLKLEIKKLREKLHREEEKKEATFDPNLL